MPRAPPEICRFTVDLVDQQLQHGRDCRALPIHLHDIAPSPEIRKTIANGIVVRTMSFVAESGSASPPYLSSSIAK